MGGFAYRRCFGIVGLVAIGCLLSKAAGSDRIQIHKDLVYSEVPVGLTLDLYLPATSEELVPCVLVIQGGGFNAQNGQKFKSFAEFLAEHGFAAALMAYRGRPDHCYRDTVADTKAAVRFIRKVSETYSIDPDRLGAMGRSAGGTLAALLAVTGGMDSFEGEGGHSEYSSRIQVAVAYAGVFDFVSRFTDEEQIALQPRVEEKMRTNGEWIGPEFSPSNYDWIQASAITHVDNQDPSILLLHCQDDVTVPWLQSKVMHEAMKGVGMDVSVIYYKEGGHGFNRLGDQPLNDMLDYFRESL